MTHRDSAALFMTSSSEWREINRVLGWWILCCPPIGWLMALGYRKYVVAHLLNPEREGDRSPLPPTPPLLNLFLEGFGALGVMIVYFTPTIALAFIWGADILPWETSEQSLRFLVFGALTYFLPPITLGGTLAYYQSSVSWFELSTTQGLMIGIALMLNTFLIPLAFMQVGERGRWRDAFRVDRSILLLFRHSHAYLGAWRDSLWISFAALSLIRRAPWGIAWSYLSIVWLFNRIHAHEFPNNLIEPLSADSADSASSTSHQFKLYYLWGVPIPMWWLTPVK